MSCVLLNPKMLNMRRIISIQSFKSVAAFEVSPALSFSRSSSKSKESKRTLLVPDVKSVALFSILKC